MAKRTLPKPTDGELVILRVLWRLGPSTVRTIHSELSESQQTGYTTVLKMMQIMAEKGLVERDESQKTHVYSAVLTEKEAQGRFFGDFLEQVFNGSAQSLVLHALSTKRATPAELASIRKLLDKMDGGPK